VRIRAGEVEEFIEEKEEEEGKESSSDRPQVEPSLKSLHTQCHQLSVISGWKSFDSWKHRKRTQ